MNNTLYDIILVGILYNQSCDMVDIYIYIVYYTYSVLY